MSGKTPTEILRQFASQAPKASSPTTTQGAPTADELYSIAAGASIGSGAEVDDEIQRDLLTLDTFELMQKYGAEEASRLSRDFVRSRNMFSQDTAATRSGSEEITDTANAVGRGFVTGIGGLGALGLGLVNDDAGAWASDQLSDFTEWSRSLDSEGLDGRRRAFEAKNQADSVDSLAQYEKEKQESGDFIASLKMIGRDTMNTIDNLDTVNAGDVISEGVGSLVGGGPVVKGASVLGRLGVKALQEGGVISRAARIRAGRASDKVAPALGVAALESGGTYQQTVNEVMGMGHEELMETSTDYQQLIKSGLSQSEAKTELANSTGLLAAAVSAPAAVAAGKLVGDFAGAPLATKGIRRALQNTGSETAEETIQGAASEFAGNVALSENVDPDTVLAEGVGSSSALGAIGGFGSAGVAQGAGLTVEAPRAAVNATKRAVQAFQKEIDRGVQEVQEQNRKASPLSEEKIGMVIEQGEQALEQYSQPETEEASPEQTIIEKFTGLIRVNPEEELIEGMSENIQAAVTGSKTRLDMIQNLAEIVENSADEQDVFVAATMLLETRARINSVMDGETVKTLQELPKNSEGAKIGQMFGGALIAMRDNKRVNAIMENVDAMIKRVAEEQSKQDAVSEQEIETPEGQERAKKTITIAEHSPENINFEQAQAVLQHASAGKISLSNEQIKTLEIASNIVGAQRAMLEEAEKLGVKTNTDVVSGEILTDRDTGVEDKKMSAAMHSRGIIEAVKAGETALAAERLERFMQFGQHMQNKVEAYNAHFAKGGGKKETGVPYMSLVNGEFRKSLTPGYVDLTSGNSIKFAQRVGNEAKAVTQIANSIAAAFPDLGVEPLEEINLDPGLQKPAKEIIQTKLKEEGIAGKAREAKRELAPQTEATPAKPEAKQPEPTPEPTQETEQEIEEAVEKPVDNVETEKEIFRLPVEDLTDADLAQEREALYQQGLAEGLQGGDKARYQSLRDEANRRAETEEQANEPEQAGPEGNPEKIVAESGRILDMPLDEITEKDLPNISDETLIELLERDFSAAVSPLSEEMQSIVDAARQRILENTGYDLGAIPRLVLEMARDSEEGGLYIAQANTITLSSFVRAWLNDGITESDVAHIYAHELTHALDFEQATAGDFFKVFKSQSTTKQSWNSEDPTEEGPLTVGGEAYNEFVNMNVDELPADARPQIEYVIESKGGIELFAEIGAMVMLFPETASKVIPVGKALFDEILEQAAKENRLVRVGDTSTEKQSNTKSIEAIEEKNAVEASVEAPLTSELFTEEEITPPADTVKNRFPNLIGQAEGSRVTNYFTKFFDNRKTRGSRIRGITDPIDYIESVGLDKSGFTATTGKGAYAERLTPALIAAYGDVLSGVRDFTSRANQQLKDNLNKENKKGSGVKRIRTLQLEGKLNEFYTGRLLNLIEKNDAGNVTFNPELVQSAALAAAQWLLTGMQQRPYRDKDWVESALGLKTAEKRRLLSKGEKEKLQEEFGRGMTQLEAINSLGSLIQKYWDVSPKSNAPKGIADGVSNAMASEMLEAMLSEGNLKISEPVLDTIGKERLKQIDYKNLTLLEPNVAASEQKLWDTLNEFPDLIDQVVLTKPEQVIQFGEPSAQIEQTQLKNERADLKPEQKAALGARQENAFQIDETAVDFTLGLSLEQAQELFGAGEINPDLVNTEDLKTREGKNISVKSAYDAVQSLVKQAQNYATANNMALGDAKVFYRYTWNRMNRLQMLGSQNPQNSKLLREVVLPTNVEADISDRSGQHFRMFAIAMAQHLGINIENQMHDVSISEVLGMLEGTDGQQARFAGSLSGIRSWLQTRTAGGKAPVPADLVATLKEELGGDMSEVAVKSLIEFARYQKASPEERKSFKTTMYIEADGKTNGAANAIMLFGSGNFTPEELDRMELGGVYFGNGPANMNEAITRKGGKDDLYIRASARLNETRNEKRRTLDNPDLIEQFDLLEQFGQMFLPKQIRVNDQGSIEFDRGFTKNPLTITMYGSGANGIASNIAEEMVSAIYERMTTALQAKAENPELSDAEAFFPNDENAQEKYDQFRETYQRLSSSRPVQSKEGATLSVDRKIQPLFNGKFKDFRVDSQALDNISANVLEFMVKPLRQAIDDTLGSTVKSNLEAVQVATNASSQVLEIAFNQESERRMALRKKVDPNFRKNDDLSQDEYIEVFEAVKHLAPVIDNKSQILYVNKEGKADAQVSFSSSLSGKFQDRGGVFVPKEAGVLGMPMIVIASADGMMQQLYAISPEGSLKTLDVFDGINVPITSAQDQGKVINRSVYEAWQRNPMTGVLGMFEGFIKGLQTSLQDGSLKLKGEDITRLALNFMDREAAGKADLRALRTAMEDTLETLQYVEGEISDRQAVFSEMQMVTDQMAGLEAAHVNEGVGSELESREAISNLMNQKLAEKREAREEKAKEAKLAPEAEEFGVEHTTGARIVSGDSINQLAKSLKPSEYQQDLIRKSLKVAAESGYKVVTGSLEQVREYLDAEGFDNSGIETNNPRKKTKGMAIPEAKIIALVDANSETLVHELIHAATLETISAHYAGSSKVGVATKRAIQRIEDLAMQFLDLDVTSETTETIIAYKNARAAIQSAVNQKNMALALNEFMAWGLSNQKLANLQKKTVATKLAQLAKRAIELIKEAIFGTGSTTKVGKDMLSNLRFNTEIVMATPMSTQGEFAKTIAFQSESYGRDEHIENINARIHSQLISHLEETETVEELRGNEAGNLANNLKMKARLENLRATYTKELGKLSNAFGLTDQEETTIGVLMTAFASSNFLDANALSKAADLHDHFLSNLTIDTFIPEGLEADPIVTNSAEAKFRALTSPAVGGKDAQDRTALLPAFLGMAVASKEFRDLLKGMPLPESARSQEGTLDARLENLGMDLIEALGRKLTKQSGREADVQAVVDVLVDQTAKTTAERLDRISTADRRITGFVDEVNGKLVDLMDRGSVWAQRKAQNVQKNTTNQAVRKAARAAEVAAMAFDRNNEEGFKQAALKAYRADNIPDIIKDAIRDIVGRNSVNAPVYDMVKRVKTYVSQARQDYRDKWPGQVAAKFNRKLEDSEWEALTTAMARTDLAALRRKFGSADILEMMQKSVVVDQQISKLENDLKTMQPQTHQLLIDKSKQLANYMMTRDPGHHLLTNAHAISQLLGLKAPKNYQVKPDQVELIDTLTSLYAMQSLDSDVRDVVGSLAQSENDGVTYLLESLRGQKAEEERKAGAAGSRALYNHYKGYFPEEGLAGVSIFVGNDRSFEDFVGVSYQRVADYENSDIDPDGLQSRGVYVAKVKPRATYSQGVMQTAQQTAGGVDMTTGLTHGRTVAGAIEDAHRVKKIYRNRFREKSGNSLIPRWESDGNISAYERSVSPEILAPQETENRLHKIMGIWHGRQVEEAHAENVNQELVRRLSDVWETERKQGTQWKKDFVNLFDAKEHKKNPVLGDIVRVMPNEMLQQIAGSFPQNEFWVRRDMLDDALGYRDASVRDVWSKRSKWDPKALRTAEKLMVRVFGNDAYRYAVNAEDIIQNVASEARTIIVVKSVVVPAANMMWNVFQLLTRGVPVSAITGNVLKKKDELNDYLKSREEYLKLELEFRAAKGNTAKSQRVFARMKAIEDRQKRLSIWPLLEAGEFSSITEGTLEGDDDLQNGKLLQFFEKAIDKLPPAARTAAKYGMISRDTALFEALQKSVQYGDFIAKAVLFDHLTKTKGVGQTDALADITEEFVNYDLQPGRSRGYLEKMGLLWFYHYKLRSVKIGARMLRNNPLQSLLVIATPIPDVFGPLGSPITDNAVSVIMDGRADYSIGPDMGLNAPSLIPTAQLLS